MVYFCQVWKSPQHDRVLSCLLRCFRTGHEVVWIWHDMLDTPIWDPSRISSSSIEICPRWALASSLVCRVWRRQRTDWSTSNTFWSWSWWARSPGRRSGTRSPGKPFRYFSLVTSGIHSEMIGSNRCFDWATTLVANKWRHSLVYVFKSICPYGGT